MTAGKRILILVLVFFCCTPVFAQKKSKAQLQKEKQQNLEKIKEVEKILSETTAKKKNSLGELNALNQRIREQENLIGSIQGEINALDDEIDENNDIISSLEKDLEKLKEEYAAMLFAAQKANNSLTRLTFLFSASSFDQFLMRLRYMEQYSETRKLQAAQIGKVQEELSGQVREIETRKSEKNTLLSDEVKENNSLTSLKKKQNSLVKSLSKEERKLKLDIEETKRAITRLDKLIDDIIREEMERAAREAREAAGKNDASVRLSASFEENKNKFPWPAPGFVSQKFGRQNHPVLKNIVIQNDGINIQTKENEKVKCIFEGEVRAVLFTQGIGKSVLVKHGEYFTTYSGLGEVFVKSGQKVSTNQELGVVQPNSEGISELRFRVYKNTTVFDPLVWLRD